MKNKVLTCILLVVLMSSLVLLGACNRTAMAEYCTITVEGFTVPNQVYEFKVVKGERFTLSQVFNTIPHNFMSLGMDLYALSYKDGKLYDESQPVEGNLQLLAISGMCHNMAYATIKVKSERLKDICISNGNYETNTFLYYGFFNEGQIASLFDLTLSDLKYSLATDETKIYESFEDLHSAVFSYIFDENYPELSCGNNVFCSPNLHYHMPHIIVYLY